MIDRLLVEWEQECNDNQLYKISSEKDSTTYGCSVTESLKFLLTRTWAVDLEHHFWSPGIIMVESLLRKPASSLGLKVCDMSRSSCPGSGSQVFINVWANINGYAIMTTRVGVWHNIPPGPEGAPKAAAQKPESWWLVLDVSSLNF